MLWLHAPDVTFLKPIFAGAAYLTATPTSVTLAFSQEIKNVATLDKANFSLRNEGVPIEVTGLSVTAEGHVLLSADIFGSAPAPYDVASAVSPLLTTSIRYSMSSTYGNSINNNASMAFQGKAHALSMMNTDFEFTDLELEETTEGSVTFNRLVLSFSDNLAVNGGTVDKEDFSLIEDGNEYTLIPEVANGKLKLKKLLVPSDTPFVEPVYYESFTDGIMNSHPTSSPDVEIVDVGQISTHSFNEGGAAYTNRWKHDKGWVRHILKFPPGTKALNYK